MNENPKRSPGELLALFFPDGLVFGLPLPIVLVEAINSDKWKTPSRQSLEKIFPASEIANPSFYGPVSLYDENMGWRYVPHGIEFVGSKRAGVLPGDIDQSKSILIGDLGIDRPIALDYRNSIDDPSVNYLRGDVEAQWVEVAPNIESFLKALGAMPHA